MRVGVAVSGTPDSALPTELAGLENAGFDSLWFGLEQEPFDPIVQAAAAATATSTIGLVVALSDVTPVTAKSIASLDALSRGRVRVLVDTAEEVALLRAMLGAERVDYVDARFAVVDAPVLPAPVQARVPIWTRNATLASVVDGLLLVQGPVIQGVVCAVMVDGHHRVAESLGAVADGGFEEAVLALPRSSWSVAGKVLAGIK